MIILMIFYIFPSILRIPQKRKHSRKSKLTPLEISEYSRVYRSILSTAKPQNHSCSHAPPKKKNTVRNFWPTNAAAAHYRFSLTKEAAINLSAN